MAPDLPIYSETPLRTGLQFAALDSLKGRNDSEVWHRADALLVEVEGATGFAEARAALRNISKQEFLDAHARAFRGRAGAGELRKNDIKPIYRGQDCAPPEFIERSLENLTSWASADSFGQIHAIERCALTITRVVDIWPFEYGNHTMALLFGNLALSNAGLTPFFIPQEHRREFDKIVAQAMTIDMQPLINAVFQRVRKEMEGLARPRQ
jgi:Fic family protein